MGLLRRAAEQLTEYVHLWDQHLRVPENLRDHWRNLAPQGIEIMEQLEAGEWPDTLVMCADLPTGIAPEGQMHWCEAWVYPSQDLLIYRDRESPYCGVQREDTPSHLPMQFEGYLQVRLEANSLRLLVDIPLNPLPWCQPRVVWKKYLEPAAKREGRPPRKAQQQWLEPARKPLSRLGQRVWVVHAQDETNVGELLTNLVVVAGKENFPFSEDDRKAAWAWMRCVMRGGLRNWHIDEHTRLQLVQDTVGGVYEALVRRFELPADDIARCSR